MKLETYLSPSRTRVLDGIADADALLAVLAETASGEGVDREALLAALRERESAAATSTPEGVAFPHALMAGLDHTIVVAVRVAGGVMMGKADHPPSDVIFCMVGSAEKPWDHVRLLARLARLARGPGALDRIRAASSDQELYDTLVSEDRSHD